MSADLRAEQQRAAAAHEQAELERIRSHVERQRTLEDSAREQNRQQRRSLHNWSA